MAYFDGVFSDPSRGSKYRLRLHVNLASQNIAGNYSTVNTVLEIVEVTEWGTFSLSPNGSSSWNIGGNVWNGGGYTYDFRSTNTKLLATGSYNIAHNADGTGGVSSSASSNSASTLGSASTSGYLALPTIPRTPAGLTLSSATPSTLTASWTAATGAGGYSLQIDTASDFSTATTVSKGSGQTTHTFTDLPPGQTYYVRVATVIGSGTSAYSAAQSLRVGIGGRRWDGSAEVPFIEAFRWDGTQEIEITTAVRWDGVKETPIS